MERPSERHFGGLYVSRHSGHLTQSGVSIDQARKLVNAVIIEGLSLRKVARAYGT